MCIRDRAWDIYEKEHPDIILTDIRMPVMDGMELIRRIRERDRETRIVILSLSLIHIFLPHLIYEIILQKMRLPLHEKYSRFITAVIMRQKRGIFSFTSLRCFVLSYVPCIIGTRTQTVVPISFLLSTVTP